MKTTLEMASEAEWHVSGSKVFSPVVEGSDLLWLLKTFEALVREECVHSVMLHSPRNGHDSPENKRLSRIVHSIRTGEHVYV